MLRTKILRFGKSHHYVFRLSLHFSVEPTVSPAALEASKAPNVDSSLIENNADESGHRAPRLGNVYATTVTSTLTSFRVITSLSKKTVLIGSNLSCMPSGFNVC